MRIALTGGSRGIGEAVVSTLIGQGHEVTCFDIERPSGDADWVQIDLSDPASITEALSAVQGPYDGLINNAGLPPRTGQAASVLQVNWLGFRQFLDGMLPHLGEGAAIVNTASRAGAAWRDNIAQVQTLMRTPSADLEAFISGEGIDPTRAYNLSKEAVIAMTVARCKEMIDRGLRMNSVSPAAVDTEILGAFHTAFGAKVAANVKRAGRAGMPQEIAEVITFLVSPASAWIKGQDIGVDGGTGAMSLADALEL